MVNPPPHIIISTRPGLKLPFDKQSATACQYITMLVIWIFAVVVGALAEVEDNNSTRTASMNQHLAIAKLTFVFV